MRPALLVIALSLPACLGADGSSGVTGTCQDTGGSSYQGCRVFRGRLLLPPASQLRLSASAFQIAGVAFQAAQKTGQGDGGVAGDAGAPAPTSKVALRLFFGEIFAQEAGGGARADVPFSIVVPCGLSVNLLLQAPGSSSGNHPGTLIAPLAFDTGSGSSATTLIPWQRPKRCTAKTGDIDLGQVKLDLEQNAPLTSASIELGKGNSLNPLSLVDTDGDGKDDLSDADDDSDGIIDPADGDADGDGIVDAAQKLTALADKDGDLVPDMFQR